MDLATQVLQQRSSASTAASANGRHGDRCRDLAPGAARRRGSVVDVAQPASCLGSAHISPHAHLAYTETGDPRKESRFECNAY